MIPKIVCSAALQVIFVGVAYQLGAGENYITDIIFGDGIYTLTFKGKGIVTVIYRGGSL